ncbi:MAG TPA: translational GTPase TypA [Oligoflexia bacterium]|nr:translational GTPase TypA [Oligoflexia bacterium]HMR25796.1 translational GTPase TypA [Oligoflexia bacterium]
MNFRNVCIIAHVDHGKTTLVDFLLKQAGTFAEHQSVDERVMDSMDLERERGITILAKNTSITVGNIKVNIVDTPGHADFGGEVERIMNMVDGAILLVDAAEGPLPQTRFVLQKALAKGHKIALVVNKVDRNECRHSNRITEVVDEVLELFMELEATDEQLDFPIIYACGREGWCTADKGEIEDLVNGSKSSDLKPLFDLILEDFPQPNVVANQDFQMLISNLAYSDYVGSLAIGKINSGSIKKGQKIIRHGLNTKKELVQESFTVTKLFTYQGLKQVDVEELQAGDIGIVAGTDKFEIGDTLAANANIPILERINVENPTLSMIFSINNSPFSGQDGEAIQSRKLRERLLREIRQNVALRFEETESSDQFRVLARGELQLAILIEQMRREGLEFLVGKPLVLTQQDENGRILEPYEIAVLDVPEESVGDLSQLFQNRGGVLSKYETATGSNEGSSNPRVRLEFTIPTKGLLGTRSKFLSITKGQGLMSSQLDGFKENSKAFLHRSQGALIADRTGDATEYALLGLEDRGIFFIDPGTKVYEGMIVGQFNKDTDLNVNVCREKKLTNFRAANADILVTLAGTKKMSLEDSIEWIDDDEWIEITPSTIRMRKKVLASNMRSVKRK